MVCRVLFVALTALGLAACAGGMALAPYDGDCTVNMCNGHLMSNPVSDLGP